MHTPHLISVLRKDAAKNRRKNRSRQRERRQGFGLLGKIKERVKAFCAKHPSVEWAMFARPKRGYPPFALTFIKGKKMPGNLRDLIGRLKESLSISFRLRILPHPKTSDNCVAFSVFV